MPAHNAFVNLIGIITSSSLKFHAVGKQGHTTRGGGGVDVKDWCKRCVPVDASRAPTLNWKYGYGPKSGIVRSTPGNYEVAITL